MSKKMENREKDREAAKRCIDLIESLPTILPARITDVYRPVKTRRLVHTRTHTQDTPKSSNNSFASSASTPRIEVSSARRNWSTQDYKETSNLYKDRGRNMKHLGDRHYQQASKTQSSDEGEKVKLLAGCELLDAVLMYAYGFWCEDRTSVPNIQNWQSLEPLAKFSRSKWDALVGVRCVDPTLLAHMQGLALFVYALVLLQISAIETTQLYHKSIKLQKTASGDSSDTATRTAELLGKNIENHKRKDRAREILDRAIAKFPSINLKIKFPRTWARAVGGYLDDSEEESEELGDDRQRAASLGVMCDTVKRVKFADCPSESLDPDSVLGAGGHGGGGFAWPLLEGGFAHDWWPHIVVYARSILDEFGQTVRLDDLQSAAGRGYIKLK